LQTFFFGGSGAGNQILDLALARSEFNSFVDKVFQTDVSPEHYTTAI
jgi:hypothetical protein